MDREYYLNEDVLFLGRDLLGKVLVTEIDGARTAAIITETESYKGPEDRASHAYNMRRTPRNEVMYKEGGHGYVYICYGIHPLFNVVTNRENVPHAILIRGIFVLDGQSHVVRRTKKHARAIVGPANVTRALGIHKGHNGCRLDCAPVWIEDRHIAIPNDTIEALFRVGIDYAGDDAKLPWRFRVKIDEFET